MIRQSDISEAIQRPIAGSALPYPVVFEAQDSVPARPYIVLQIVRLEPRTVMLAPHQGVHPQYLQATVVTEAGEFATLGQDIADEIVDILPFGTRIPFANGTREITVTRVPFVETGFRDGFDWRTPVRIDYEAQ